MRQNFRYRAVASAGASIFARVWGSGAFEGQTVQRDHVLADGDVVEIHG